MDAVITKILEIENRSRDIMREAEDKQGEIDKLIEEEREQMRQSLTAQATARLADDRNAIINKAQEDADKHLVNAKSKIEAMERFTESKREAWLDELYARITDVKE